MSDQDNEKKELTDVEKLVNKDISDALKLLKGAAGKIKGIEKKLDTLKKKASEE